MDTKDYRSRLDNGSESSDEDTAMLSLTSGMKYMYCEGTVSFRYKWDGLESYIKYVLEEDPRSGKVFIFMHTDRRHLRVFYYERNGYVLSEKFLDRAYRFVRPIFDVKKMKYNICWADFVLLLEDAVVTKVYLTEVA